LLLRLFFCLFVFVVVAAVQAMCNEPQLAKEENCRERSAGFVFLPVVGATTLFWTLGEFKINVSIF
jgi:hypothetical protein